MASFHGASLLALRLLLVVFLLATSFCRAQRCGTSQRRPWRALSCAEQDQFLNAVLALKQSGVYDELAQVHWQTGSAAHQRPEFLPWHRYYIWIFEQQLQAVSNSCITIPYWDWEREGSSLDTILKASTFGSEDNGGCVADGIAADWQSQGSNGGCLQRAFDQRISLSSDVEVLSRITNSRDFAAFSVQLEGAPHSSVHQFIGGSMSNSFSSSDPLFWLHHANVDRIWTLWQNYYGHPSVDPGAYGFEHYSANLDVQLTIEGDRGGYFSRPTVRELLSNQGLINVQYLNDNLARNLVESSGRFASEINEGWNSPGRVGSDQCNGNNNLGGNSGIDNDQEQQQQEVPQGQDETNCLETFEGCRFDGECCSGDCQGGTCVDSNIEQTENPQEQQEQQEQQQQEQQQQQQCLESQETCNQNRQCCSNWCVQGQCWGPNSGENGDENGNNENPQQQTCRAGGQSCSRNRHCCSNWCQGGECWEANARDTGGGDEDGSNANSDQQQSPSCLDSLQGCFRNSDCCSSWCEGGLCREVNNEEVGNGQQQSEQNCQLDQQSCNRSRDCCSGLCRWGSCRRYRDNLRRATSLEENKYWQVEAWKPVVDEPFLSSSALDARWQELVNLYNTSSPEQVFETLGREDCENRTRATNHTIMSASLDFIKLRSQLNIVLVHTFDCHYVISGKDESKLH